MAEILNFKVQGGGMYQTISFAPVFFWTHWSGLCEVTEDKLSLLSSAD